MRAGSLVCGLGVPCRGCLGVLDDRAEAGLCGRCWAGLLALPEGRCERCALLHEAEGVCPEPVAWRSEERRVGKECRSGWEADR